MISQEAQGCARARRSGERLYTWPCPSCGADVTNTWRGVARCYTCGELLLPARAHAKVALGQWVTDEDGPGGDGAWHVCLEIPSAEFGIAYRPVCGTHPGDEVYEPTLDTGSVWKKPDNGEICQRCVRVLATYDAGPVLPKLLETLGAPETVVTAAKEEAQ